LTRPRSNSLRDPLLRLIAAPALALILIAGGCSDDSDSGDDASSEEGEQAEEVRTECEEPAEEGDTGALEAVEERGEPEVEPRKDPEPGSTVLIEGDGEEIPAEGSVEIHDVVYVASSGEVQESSWDAGEPTSVNIAEVFPAFSEAVVGQKVGARIEIVVPVADIYGGEVPPEAGFAADDVMVFVIDVISTGEADDAAPETDEAALEAAKERGEPEVEVPEEVPTELVIIDDVEGEGSVVCEGDSVVALYKGVGMNSGEVFDTTWDDGQPVPFSLDGVIQGWTEGLPGMRVGGRRTLVIPAEMAYGDNPPSEDIEPGEALVFTVDMVGAG
jgi:peptidylprolyl isomerase